MARTNTSSDTDVGHRHDSPSDFCLFLLALFIPPFAVFLKCGFRSHFWLNIILWLCGALPAVLHAGFVCFSLHRDRRSSQSERPDTVREASVPKREREAEVDVEVELRKDELRSLGRLGE